MPKPSIMAGILLPHIRLIVNRLIRASASILVRFYSCSQRVIVGAVVLVFVFVIVFLIEAVPFDSRQQSPIVFRGRSPTTNAISNEKSTLL